MTVKDFYRLPLGTVEGFDGIYKYLFRKSLCEDGRFIVQITEKQSPYGHSVAAFEAETYYHEDERDRWRYGYFKRKTLSWLSGFGSFRIHDNEGGYLLGMNDVIIQPRGSFKNYVEKEI